MAQIFGESSASASSIIDGAPAALDTLNELAAALNDDANFAGTVTTALAAKAPLASPTFTGHITTEGVTANGATGTGKLVFATNPSFPSGIVSGNILSSDVAGNLGFGNNVDTGSISAGAGLTSGSMSLATGSTFAGTVNIATGALTSGTKAVNIGTGASSPANSAVTIGSTGASSSVINLNGTVYANATTFVKALENGNGNGGAVTLFPSLTTGSVTIAGGTSFTGTVNVATGTITSGTKTINIGGGATNTATSNINIGSSSGIASTIYLYGNTYAQALYSRTATGLIGLFTDNTTGGINMGSGLTSGNVDIATGTSFAASVNVASGITTSGTKVVRLGTGGGAGSTTQVHVGSNLGTSTTNLYGKVVINDGASHVPASATATGTAGQVAWDANYIYVCTATDTWVRAALSTW